MKPKTNIEQKSESHWSVFPDYINDEKFYTAREVWVLSLKQLKRLSYEEITRELEILLDYSKKKIKDKLGMKKDDIIKECELLIEDAKRLKIEILGKNNVESRFKKLLHSEEWIKDLKSDEFSQIFEEAKSYIQKLLKKVGKGESEVNQILQDAIKQWNWGYDTFTDLEKQEIEEERSDLLKIWQATYSHKTQAFADIFENKLEKFLISEYGKWLQILWNEPILELQIMTKKRKQYNIPFEKAYWPKIKVDDFKTMRPLEKAKYIKNCLEHICKIKYTRPPKEYRDNPIFTLAEILWQEEQLFDKTEYLYRKKELMDIELNIKRIEKGDRDKKKEYISAYLILQKFPWYFLDGNKYHKLKNNITGSVASIFAKKKK